MNMFGGAAANYDRFMGRYSQGLSAPFADFAGVHPGQRVLDVGSGPGALTTVLVDRLGAGAVAAADPSEPYAAAARSGIRRWMWWSPPPSTSRSQTPPSTPRSRSWSCTSSRTRSPASARWRASRAPAASSPRACRDHEGGAGPLSGFWDVVHELDPAAHDESGLPGARRGHLTELFTEAGLTGVEETLLTIEVVHPTFDDWWEPYTLGVGPAGAYVAGLDDEGRERLREACRRRYPREPFTMTAGAWSARGAVR